MYLDGLTLRHFVLCKATITAVTELVENISDY